MNKFLTQENCDRCGESLDGKCRIMSIFNTDCICLECKEAEKEHPKYKEARDAEHAEVKRGNYNFKGIGFN